MTEKQRASEENGGHKNEAAKKSAQVTTPGEKRTNEQNEGSP
jgi:hypothetical protein